MARKLPWNAQPEQEPYKSPIKRVTTAPPKQIKKDEARPTTPEPDPSNPLKRGSPRSPSTSPIHPPTQTIPEIEPMREGLQADDRYIMVEDEFEAVAKQFTAHLHAAEYARLKAKARSAPPKPLPESSSNMSRTTQQNLERRRLLSRQNTMLSELSGRSKTNRRSSGAGAGGEGHVMQGEEDDDKVDDPWSGTSLAGLMGQSSQVKTSLIGLERVGSSTRAAKGFARGETDTTPKKKSKTIADIFASEFDDQDNNTSVRNNVLDNASPKKPTTVKDSSTNTATKRRHGALDDEEPTSVKNSTTQVSNTKIDPPPRPSTFSSRSYGRRSRIADFDDFDVTQISPAKTSSSVTAGGRKPVSSKKTDAKKDRKSRLDEVPVFLV